ncbi:hypothetical protein ACFX11_023355 [Malus domestica]
MCCLLSDGKTTMTYWAVLIFNLLANLCGYADGRDQLLKHGGGMQELSILLSSSSTLRSMKLNLQRRWFGQRKNNRSHAYFLSRRVPQITRCHNSVSLE